MLCLINFINICSSYKFQKSRQGQPNTGKVMQCSTKRVVVSWLGMNGASSKGSVVPTQRWGQVHHFVKHIIFKGYYYMDMGTLRNKTFVSVCKWLHLFLFTFTQCLNFFININHCLFRQKCSFTALSWVHIHIVPQGCLT